jgi:hypothetical protein
VEEGSTKKSIGYVVFGCILAVAADSFIVRILENAEVVQPGALRLPFSLTDPIFVLISIPMLLFFIKVKNKGSVPRVL